MVLYACASCILGWTGVTSLTQTSLRTRGLASGLGFLSRALIVLVCVAGALGAWLLLDSLVCCLSFSFACACMAALLVCDLREHVLPTELVAALLVCALAFRMVAGDLAETLALALPAALVTASLLLVNHLRMRRGASEFMGAGDLRMLVPLALFSGATGIMPGLFACATLMGLLALVQLACGKAGRHTQIALAPGLTVWLFVGTLLPFA